MITRQDKLAERRRTLISAAAAQRLSLAHSVEPWHAPLKVADQGISALRFVRNHKAWALGTALLPALLPASGVGKWLRRGLVAVQLIHRFRGRRSPEPLEGPRSA